MQRCKIADHCNWHLIANIIIIVSSLFIGCTKSNNIARDKDKIDIIIKKYFSPDYSLMRNSLDTLTNKYFKENYSKSDPYLIEGDFDGNDLTDVAVVLQKNENNIKITSFAILLQTIRGCYKSVFIADVGTMLSDIYIIPVGAGEVVRQTESIDVPMKQIKLKNKAVTLVYYGKSAVVYYWDESKQNIDSIWTSD